MSAERNPGDFGFHVLQGGRRLSATFAGIHLVVARADDAPFPIDAAAFEEDTWLALSAETDAVVSPGHPVRVMTQVWNEQPREPGSVVVRPGSPARLLAIIHDMDRDPSWTKEWIEQALAGVLRAAAARGCESLRLPLLGTKHGRLPPLAFVEMLRRTLASAAVRSPESPPPQRIWLVRERESGAELLQALTRPDAGAT